jgi:HEXXH motif-containing protein
MRTITMSIDPRWAEWESCVMHRDDDGYVPEKHRIPAGQLAELCAGGGDVATMRTLWAGQRSRRLLLLDTVRKSLNDPDDMGPLPPAAAAWSALVDAGDDALLLHPQVGSWAAYTLRRKRGKATSDLPLWLDAGVLHSIALVANARAGRSWQTSVPLRNGRVMLPTLGMAFFDDRDGASTAQALCTAGRIHFRHAGQTIVVPPDPTQEVEGWWPLRRLRVGGDLTLSVYLDDIDPSRELADPVAPDRLGDDSVARWTKLLDGAWTILCEDHAATARALAEGVVSLVPLPVDELGTTRSASTGEAFGSVMVSPPADEVDLAVSLVHEFQHIKLGGLLHLMPLTDDDGEAIRHAPWRDDPRPLSGLVQGVYAFYGIADFWRTRRLVSQGAHRRIADFEFAYAGGQVREALTALTASDGLTDAGRTLVDGLAARVRFWDAEPLDPVAASSADVVCRSHRAEWRLRYVRPDGRQVRSLAAAWAAGEPAGLGSPRHTIAPPAKSARWSLGWEKLARAHLVGRVDRMDAAVADVAVMSGDDKLAGESYRRDIAAHPGDAHAWAGLSIITDEEPLRSRPEWVRALFVALRAHGENVEPLAISQWLAHVLPSPT